MNYFDYMASYISGNGIVKMADFACKMNGAETNFNDVAMDVLFASVQGGGSVQMVTVEDIGGKLKKHISSKGNILVQTALNGFINSYPTVSYNSRGVAQVSFQGVMCEGIYFEYAANLQFSNDSDLVNIWCKTTVFA
jgi:hypothetical protein